MRARLKLKRYDADTIDAVIGELKRLGYIDDAKFAQFWIESRMHANPAGDTVLRYELKAKGVGDAVIDAALQRRAEEFDDFAIASRIAGEKFARFAKLDRRKALKRLHDFLYRRGFAYDVIQRVIDDLVGKVQ